MIYPSKNYSRINIGESINAIFNLVWYSPGSCDPPASFDLVVSVAREITNILKFKKDEDNSFEYSRKDDLIYFLTLTERHFGLVIELNPHKGVVWDDLRDSNNYPDEWDVEKIMKAIQHWKNKDEKLTDLFIISGSPSKGYVTVRKDSLAGNKIIIGFHEWDDNYERIKVNITVETFLSDSYPASLLPGESWPRENVLRPDGTHGPGERMSPTIYYMTKFMIERRVL